MSDQKETTSQEQEPEPLTATDLVGVIGQAGPGGQIKVRSHFLPDASTKVGFTTWMSENTKGPAVYYYRDPRKQDWISGILPLDGQTFIVTPSMAGKGNGRSAPIESGSLRNWSEEVPVNPATEEHYRFEILPEDEMTPEEEATIQALDKAAL